MLRNFINSRIKQVKLLVVLTDIVLCIAFKKEKKEPALRKGIKKEQIPGPRGRGEEKRKEKKLKAENDA